MEERDWGDNKISTTVRSRDYYRLYRYLNNSITVWFIQLLYKISPSWGAKLSWTIFSSPNRRRRRPRDMFRVPDFKKGYYYLEGKDIKKVYTYFFGDRTKPTILLVHGWAKQGLDFYKFIPHLLNAGYSVVAFDGPAHGASEGDQTNAKEFVDIINRLWRKCGYFEAIIAHSFGAMAASIALEQNPKMAKKLITIGAPNHLEGVLKEFTGHVGMPKVVYKKFTRNIEDFYGIKIEDISTAESIKKSMVPTLLVHDKDDVRVPFKRAIEINQSCPNTELLITERLGHNKILFDLDTISKIITFIQSASTENQSTA